jgi:tRNA threonylcarbamoyladenosine biosynthesis protein TsaB
MRILSVDTTTFSCSVGVLENGLLKAEATSEKKQTHSRHLMKMVDRVMRMAEMKLFELDAFAVVTGPGSFTGIRIGMGTIQGFATALSKPVVGVSSLEAHARQVLPTSHLICPLMDARKGEVYMALYRYENENLYQVMADRVASLESVLDRMVDGCLFIGSGVGIYEELIRKRLGGLARFADQHLNKLRAETVCRIAMHKIQTGDMDSETPLTPRYIRKSDAEIAVRTHEHSQSSSMGNY